MDETRAIDCRYLDPLDLVWLEAARRLGLRVERSDEVFASWDGRETLTIGTRETFDADDCLAQMILHELCHALVEGEGALARPDWGLCNRDDRDLVREHAAHRLQAALADAHGLRGFFGVTTNHRSYWDALPADPLATDGDPAVAPARAAHERARTGAWAETLDAAFAATAAIAAAVADFAPPDVLWARADLAGARADAASRGARDAASNSRDAPPAVAPQSTASPVRRTSSA